MDTRKKLAIVVGDTHLAERTWTNRRTLVGDSMHSFKQAVDKALLFEIPMILLGDIFDAKNVSSAVLKFFCEQMTRLQELRIPVFFVQGNHDITTPPWPEVHEWPMSINDMTISLSTAGGKCNCYGLDYMPMSQYAPALSQIPEGVDVLFTHQAWTDFGKMGSSECASAQMLPRAITVATGDLHVAMKITSTAADGGEVRMMSAGATCMQAINEPDEHMIYTMVIGSDGLVDFDPIPLRTREKYQFNCVTQGEFDQVVQWIAKVEKTPRSQDDILDNFDISAPIVRVGYPMSISGDSYVRLVTAANKRGVHLFTDPQIEAPPQSTIDVGDVRTERMSTLGDAIQLLDAEPQEVRDLATRMLDQVENVFGFLTTVQKQYAEEKPCELSQSK